MEKVSVTFLAVLALAALSPALGASTKAAKAIQLDDVLNGNFSAASYSGTWISDTELQYWRDGNLYKVNVESNVETLVLDGSTFDAYKGNSLSFSADKRFVLITYERENIWRHSYVAKYVIYDTTTDAFEEDIFPVGAVNEKLMLFQWAPTGNSFVFVHENDIYYRSSAIKATVPRRLTNDGSATIINGHSDWVYEEEMFGSSKALWFSKDAKTLAYVTFNDADVENFQYPHYGEPGNRDTVYPEWTQIRYPKAGQTNPTATVKTIDLTIPDSQPVTYLSQADPLYHYVATVAWKSNTELLIVSLNRLQQRATWSNCDISTTACLPVLSLSETAGWVDVSNPVFSSDGTHFLTILPRKLEAGTYKQIVKVRVSDKVQISITNQQFSVDSISAWDETNKKIYFAATGLADGKVSPSENQVYEVADSDTVSAAAKCLTCGLTNTDSEVCKSNRASFSTAFKYFLHSCGGPGIPETVLRLTASGTSQKVMEQNADLRKKLESVPLPIVKDYSIPIGTTGFNATARLYLPPTFDENQNMKYPLFIDVYGGPDSQKITEGYSVHWGTSLVTDKNIIYGYIDGRGSGRQSKELMFELYRKLGTVEIEDQISTTKWLVENTKFIDGEQTAIWGWSYGGYATAMAMVRDTENVFKCGISVAPVTSWLYYDTIYTERYMNQPSENDEGYKTGEVTAQVDNFKNKQFFLVHGNADDNVHYQQSMILSRALEKADIMFNQLSYPDEDHSIGSAGMRRHLYHSLEKFLFRDCFAKGAFRNGGIAVGVNLAGIVLPFLAVLVYNFLSL